MLGILSDNSKIEAMLWDICAFLERNDGVINPEIEILNKNGETSIFASDELSGEYILRVPHELLIPYDAFDLDVEGRDIVIEHYDKNISKNQLQLFDMILTLYNETGKFSRHLEACPWLSFNKTPDIINHFFAAREGDDINLIKQIIDDPEFFNELALITLFKNRLAKCRLHSKQAEAQQILMPVIEFLNHHPRGAGYDNLYNKNGGHMAVKASISEENSQECFACYGRLDAMDTYLHYSYIDQNTEFVRSVPVNIELRDIGTISVRAFNISVPANQIPEHMHDLGFYFPRIQVDHSKKQAQLSHMFIPQDNALFSLRRILKFIIQLLQPDISKKACLEAIGISELKIIESNLSYYEELKSMAVNNNERTIIECGCLELSNCQIKKILHYNKMISTS